MRSVELFAGAGGLGMGADRAGFAPAAVVERDRHCCAAIRGNRDRGLEPLARWPLFEGDVRDFDFAAIGGGIDLVSGGPPCQPFSLGGRHRGPLDERDMFPQAIRAVRELRPRAFLFENVRGLARPAFANYFEYIRLRLAYPESVPRAEEGWIDHLARLERRHAGGRSGDLSYRVVARVLNAADYGVPQRRERVFIVGFRADLGVEWSFPPPTHSRDALLWAQWRAGGYWEARGLPRPAEGGRAEAAARRLAGEPALRPWRTARDALAGLPDPETEPEAASRHANHRSRPGARSYPGHTGSPPDEPAKALKAGDHGVPGGENMLRHADGSVRYFTVRESARLQTFPDEFLFPGSWTETMRQLGNAVPVALAEALANSISTPLEKPDISA